MTDIRDVKCAACNVPIQGPSDSDPKAIFSCPSCGVSDTAENIVREVGEYVQEQGAEYLDSTFRDVARRNKSFKFTPARRQKKTYRFVIGWKLHR